MPVWGIDTEPSLQHSVHWGCWSLLHMDEEGRFAQGKYDQDKGNLEQQRSQNGEWEQRTEALSKVSLTLWVWDIYPRLLAQISFWFELVSCLCANKLRWRQLEAKDELWTCKPRDKSDICSKRQMEDSVGKHYVPTGTQVYPSMEEVPPWKQGCCLSVCSCLWPSFSSSVTMTAIVSKADHHFSNWEPSVPFDFTHGNSSNMYPQRVQLQKSHCRVESHSSISTLKNMLV